jgi:redox-sensitive bicupin YhaK (pirin superfamily)
MDHTAIIGLVPLGFPWPTLDPFLFCVHHDDAYPAGNEAMGPAASLAGREIGQDFDPGAAWRMYHGDVVPGFPQHPHRGFETVTIVQKGTIDHSDSLGATARFGRGDVQWLTAGKGINHSEMFPLRDRNAPNPLELFQIWLNLPRAGKMVDPYFSMFWHERIPVVTEGGATVSVIAGNLGGVQPLPPPPSSWAAQASADLAIWTIALAPGARFTLPPAAKGSNRMLYFFRGEAVLVANQRLDRHIGVRLDPEAAVTVENHGGPAELLVLQGRPIGEPVAQYGPFVMNTRAELQQAFVDYQRTRFGGWSWSSDAPVHPRERGRFARHADGRVEQPEEPEVSPPGPGAV